MTAPGAYIRKTKRAPRVYKDLEEPDWAALVNELVRHGYSKLSIATACNCSREWIYAMMKGRTPFWNTGQCLIKLVMNIREQ